MKSRNIKLYEYKNKFGDLPNNKDELINYIIENDNINIDISDYNFNYENTLKIILFEIPEGAKRPRARLTRSNIIDNAIKNPNFIHIYSPCAKEDNLYMKRLINDGLIDINSLICTPCIVNISAFIETPKSFNKREKLLAEYGIIRPLSYPDWDNIGKKYCDMFNQNIWLDDKLCIEGSVKKFYSIKPRIEIDLKYSDMFYTKKQTKSIAKSIDVNINDLNYLV